MPPSKTRAVSWKGLKTGHEMTLMQQKRGDVATLLLVNRKKFPALCGGAAIGGEADFHESESPPTGSAGLSRIHFVVRFLFSNFYVRGVFRSHDRSGHQSRWGNTYRRARYRTSGGMSLSLPGNTHMPCHLLASIQSHDWKSDAPPEGSSSSGYLSTVFTLLCMSRRPPRHQSIRNLNGMNSLRNRASIGRRYQRCLQPFVCARGGPRARMPLRRRTLSGRRGGNPQRHCV